MYYVVSGWNVVISRNKSKAKKFAAAKLQGVGRVGFLRRQDIASPKAYRSCFGGATLLDLDQKVKFGADFLPLPDYRGIFR